MIGETGDIRGNLGAMEAFLVAYVAENPRDAGTYSSRKGSSKTCRDRKSTEKRATALFLSEFRPSKFWEAFRKRKITADKFVAFYHDIMENKDVSMADRKWAATELRRLAALMAVAKPEVRKALEGKSVVKGAGLKPAPNDSPIDALRAVRPDPFENGLPRRSG